ncbi:MAG: hypothetical protein ACJ8IQ_01515 [Chthoniobacterales bacterium]|jgi:hypothetical protein
MADTRDIAELRGPQSHFGAWFAVMLLFAVFSAFVWVAIGAGPRGTDFETKRANDRTDKLKATHDQADKNLNSYAWVDKDKGVARIPIEQAMKVTLAELSQKKPAPAGPIAPDANAGGAQNAAPVTPPQGSQPAPSPSATPVSKGGHEPEAQNAAKINPAPVAPGTQPGANATPAASPPSQSQQPNPNGPPQAQPTATPHGSPIPVPGKTP